MYRKLTLISDFSDFYLRRLATYVVTFGKAPSNADILFLCFDRLSCMAGLPIIYKCRHFIPNKHIEYLLFSVQPVFFHLTV